MLKEDNKQSEFIVKLIEIARSHRKHYQAILDDSICWNISIKNPNRLKLTDNYLMQKIFEGYDLHTREINGVEYSVELDIDGIKFEFYWDAE